MEININNCQDCPFANCDNERGYEWCNLYEKLTGEQILPNNKTWDWDELPEDSIHEKCPLKIDNHLNFNYHGKNI